MDSSTHTFQRFALRDNDKGNDRPPPPPCFRQNRVVFKYSNGIVIQLEISTNTKYAIIIIFHAAIYE